MLAMAGNNLEVARNAAQAAYEAKQDILITSRHGFLLDYSIGQDSDTQLSSVPDKRRLLNMWHEFCCALPADFPVPDNVDQSLDALIDG
jgi:hypothetical protein